MNEVRAINAIVADFRGTYGWLVIHAILDRDRGAANYNEKVLT